MNPIWLVARGDSQKVYVLTEGDGKLVTIDVVSDTVTSSLPVGVGSKLYFLRPQAEPALRDEPGNADGLCVFRYRRTFEWRG